MPPSIDTCRSSGLGSTWHRSALRAHSAVMVAEHEANRRGIPLVTIPVDDGELARPACRHSVRLLTQQGLLWAPLEALPEALVCAQMIGHGVHWVGKNRHSQWPVFVGSDGTVHVGADVRGLRVVGLDLSQEKHDEMVSRWMNAPK